MVGSLVRVVGLGAIALVLAGCVGFSALDGALPVVLRVSTTPTTVDVDAPGWFADVSRVFVCPTEPPPLPDANADRIGWSPGGDCHDYGRFQSRDGLSVSLPVADLQGSGWSTFEAAGDWYLMVQDLNGDLVTSVVRTRFHAPKAGAG